MDQRDVLQTSRSAYFDLNQLGLAGWRRLETELGGELKVQWGGSVAWSHAAPADGAAEDLRENVRRHQEWGYATHLIDEERVPAPVAERDAGRISARLAIASLRARWIRWMR